jgi:mRNA-degrading endonuclease RelE of RelBE toxin-antitoxin system
VADYTVVFVRSARRELEALPDELGERILARIRVGDYRVVYEVHDETRSVEISYIRHRREVYRQL